MASAELGRLVQEAFGRPRALPLRRPALRPPRPHRSPPPHLSPLLLCEGLPPCPCRQGCRASTPYFPFTFGGSACDPAGPRSLPLISTCLDRASPLLAPLPPYDADACPRGPVPPRRRPARIGTTLVVGVSLVPRAGAHERPRPGPVTSRTSGTGSLPSTWCAAAPPDGSQPQAPAPGPCFPRPLPRAPVCVGGTAGHGRVGGWGHSPGIPAPLPPSRRACGGCVFCGRTPALDSCPHRARPPAQLAVHSSAVSFLFVPNPSCERASSHPRLEGREASEGKGTRSKAEAVFGNVQNPHLLVFRSSP